MMSYRPITYLGLLILPLLLAGCASSPLQTDHPSGAAEAMNLAHARQALSKADLCCTQFSQFDFSKDLPHQLQYFSIGPKRPVADFGGSRSWFLAFRLPQDHSPPYDILFKSTLAGHWLHHSYLFAPSVVVLDAAYRPLKIKDVQLCEYIGWTSDTSGAFGHVTISKPAARYLVVYTSGRQLSGNTYWEQSPTAFSAEDPVKMVSKGSFNIPHGPNGVLYVGKLTAAYHGVVANAICGNTTAP